MTDGKANIAAHRLRRGAADHSAGRGTSRASSRRNCPNCKIVQEINVGVTEWGTKIQPAVQSAVQAHPEINVVIPIYDSMSQFVVPALRLTGKTGAVKVGDLQRHAVRARLHSAGQRRHGYRRKPRLDRLCDRRRSPARCSAA